MAILEDSGPYGSPNTRPCHSGRPALQAASEAQDRCDARHKWHKEHPDEMGPDDWHQRAADYAAIEKGQSLLGCCGGRVFEPGDAFICNDEEK